jgi:hypothetical protein
LLRTIEGQRSSTLPFLFLETAMSFIAKLLNDKEKSVNPVHVMMLILIASSIGWVWYLVIKTHLMPELSGVAMLLGGGGIANIAHKAEDIVAKFKSPGDDQHAV